MRNFTLPRGPCNFLNLRTSPWEILFLLPLCSPSLWHPFFSPPAAPLPGGFSPASLPLRAPARRGSERAQGPATACRAGRSGACVRAWHWRHWSGARDGRRRAWAEAATSGALLPRVSCGSAQGSPPPRPPAQASGYDTKGLLPRVTGGGAQARMRGWSCGAVARRGGTTRCTGWAPSSASRRWPWGSCWVSTYWRVFGPALVGWRWRWPPVRVGFDSRGGRGGECGTA
jgi:hypothetical protein